MRGMIVPSERWRVATIGDWEMTGTHLPQKEQKDNLFLVCKELYKLFSTTPFKKQATKPVFSAIVWDFFVPSINCPARATAIYFGLFL